MTDRANADDFNGEVVFPLPIHGYVEYGKYDKGFFGIEGNWEVLKSTEKKKRPTAAVDRENKQFVIATFPGGWHDDISEVDIAHSANYGTFVVMDIFQEAAKEWLPSQDFQVLNRDDTERLVFYLDSIDYGSFDEGITAALLSKSPDSRFGKAIVFKKPETQYLDRIVDQIPFKTESPTLKEASELVIQELGLPRGKQQKSSKRGNVKKGRELQEKFRSLLEQEQGDNNQ
jgi:hypothetical protein